MTPVCAVPAQRSAVCTTHQDKPTSDHRQDWLECDGRGFDRAPSVVHMQYVTPYSLLICKSMYPAKKDGHVASSPR